MTVYEAIAALVQYGIDTGLTPECERIYTTNQLLEIMQLDDYEEPVETTAAPLEEILDVLLADACSRGLTQDSVVYRDLFDTKLMNALMPRPSQVREAFWNEYKESPEKATEYFYKLSQDSNYIRRYRVCKDMKWMTATEYGDLDITINLSKPEKDPKAIAAARTQKQSGYPKCLLCIQNEGYAGRVNHPARQNHRIIPITINQSQWGFQYSPYVYYNEHCIVFCGEHSPMKIDRSTFVKLFDFVGQFPHYFLGSNADLPIVGGSILTHDHFQGGHYEFAMAKAPYETEFSLKQFPDVHAGTVKWPMSVIRLQGNNAESLVGAADCILSCWRGYTDEKAFIFSETQGISHNTITPIARKRGDLFELEPADPYTDEDLNYSDDDSRVVYEHDHPDDREVELVADTVENWAEYDTVFIGYPIWWGIAAWPVDSFIEANDFTGKTVVPFCTSASSGLGESDRLLAEMAGTGNWLEGRRFSSSVSAEDVQTWLESLGL